MFKLLVFLAVVFAFAALAWMLFLPVVVTSQLRARTGFDATLGQLSVNPFTGEIEVRSLVLTNPPTFPVKEFLELRTFRANANVLSLFSDQPVFDTMTVDIATVTLVKNREGATNAEVFQRHLQAAPAGPLPKPKSAPTGDRSRGGLGGKAFLVHRLSLRIDQLVVADHSLRQPRVQDFRLGIDQKYEEVSDLQQIFAPAVLKNLAPVAAAAAGLLPGDWGGALRDATKSSAELLKEAGRKAEVQVKGFFDALEESKKP